MATQIQEIRLPDGELFFVAVEVSDEIAIPYILKEIKDLPPGAEPTGVARDTIDLFNACIKNVVKITRDALEDIRPDEFTVEMSIGFVGKATPIPYIAGAGLEGGVKVTATWKKNTESSIKNSNNKRNRNI